MAQGVQIGFNTGTIDAGASFTVKALTPRDTFTYTVNSEVYTPPVIVVSYSDPQGSHRFVTPVELPSLGDSLISSAGQMRKGLQLEIVATDALNTTSTNTVNLVVNNPHPATIVGGHLHLNFVSDGKLVLERSHTLDMPAGPTIYPATWSLTDFGADYQPDGDNLLIAFWTDSENNIIDSTARPLATFAVDPKPGAATDATTWNFGTVTQGEVLQKNFSVASIGALNLKTYLSPAPGVTISQVGSQQLGVGDIVSYMATLDTRTLPAGPYNQTIILRTSDPAHPTYTIDVTGVIAPVVGDAYARMVVDRPLDVEVWVPGSHNTGEWITFTHSLGPQPADLHPVKVYDEDSLTLLGFGKLATLPASCADIKEQFLYATDGIYTLHLERAPNAPFQIFCRDMNSTPREYLSLVNTGGSFNYSMIAEGGWWHGTNVYSRFQMLRVDPETLVVNLGDLTYAVSTGSVSRYDSGADGYISLTSRAYAYASTCKFTSDGLASANVDLRGTPFRLDDSVGFRLWGHVPAGSTSISNDRQIVNLTGGGACGDNAPATPFKLKYVSPLTPEGYIIEQANSNGMRLKLPADITDGALYHVRFGNKLDFAAPGGLTTLLRVPTGNWTAASLDALVSGVGTGDITFKLDVGNDGTWDWEETRNVTNAATFSTAQLAAAFAPYVTGSGPGDVPVDIPVKVYLSQPGQVLLTNFVIERNQVVDLTPALTVAATPTEGATVPLNATITNRGTVDSGPLTVAYYAAARHTPAYIGSTFIANIPAGSSASAPFDWTTLGFTGPITVTAVVDPYNRLAESDETNNSRGSQLTILTRPDLTLSTVILSKQEPLVGETVQVIATLTNRGQTATGEQNLTLYQGNPDGGGTVLQSQTISSLAATAEHTVTFSWTPSEPGLHRLFLRSDGDNRINEFDERNNDRWLDLYVGASSPLTVDSGAPDDTIYTSAKGFGVLDLDEPDEISNCGDAAYQSFRRDPAGKVTYQFDHLLPGRFYHLDLVLYECGQNYGRQQSVSVDGLTIAGPIDLGSGNVETLSLLLDPALYADRSIRVTVSVNGSGGAIVNQIALVDVDYRYADAGGGKDLPYPAGTRPYGWLDGVRQTPWGKLPYQSLRENQAGATVRYRFDALLPDKEYQVHFGFFQGSGNNRVQQIAVDDLPLSGDFTLLAGQRNIQRVTLPQESYADGTITITVRRADGATAGAMINEIALEEVTQQPPPYCQVTGTPNYSIIYGDVMIDGQPAPVDSIVTVENPRGDVVGCFVVDRSGQYGYMSIFGEDRSSSPVIPGMRSGEPVLFRVNGAMAVPSEQLYWQDDKSRHRINLTAGDTRKQYLLLRPRWNLISTRMMPPVSLLELAFQSIAEKYCLVLGQNGIYDCNVPASFRGLREIAPGRGYYVKVEGDAGVNLVIEGMPAAANTALPLQKGLNWVGYLPAAKLPVATALQPIAGQLLQVTDGQARTYAPNDAGFNTLHELAPGEGYLIHVSDAVTLTYPMTDTGQSAAGDSSERTDAIDAVHCAGVEPTPRFTLLYGYLSLAGVDVTVGDQVEAVTPRWEVAGCFTVTTAGQYGFMPLFGSDGSLPGFQPDEPIILRVNGRAIVLPETLFWQDDKSTHRLDLGVDESRPNSVYLPSISR